jgi:hypothetical protein
MKNSFLLIGLYLEQYETYEKAVRQLQKYEKYNSMMIQAETMRQETNELKASNWLLQQEILEE